jgi:hypothetical protein
MVTCGIQDRNQVGDAGAKAIGKALRVNCSVKELSLVRLLFVWVMFGVLVCER